MFPAILSFELRQQFSSPVFWIVAAVFALLGFGVTSSDAVQMGGSIGNVDRNAPTVIVGLLGGFTSLSMLLVTIFIAGAAIRDFENRTAELFFTTPMQKRDYLLGRFAGGWLAAFGVMLAATIGMFAGYWMPWVDQARIGAHGAGPYLWSFGVIVLPNLLFIGALLFCIAVATRSMLATYVGVIAFFAINIVTGTLTADLDTRWIGALLDPFGNAAIDNTIRYWSTSERNTSLPPLDGILLANRLLWVGIGLGLLALAYSLFRTDREGLQLRLRRRPAGAASGGTGSAATTAAALPPVTLRTDAGAQWRQFLHQARFDTRGVLQGAPLRIMLLLGLSILLITLLYGSLMFGTELYPTTDRMSGAIGGSFSLFLLIIVAFYAGELVWRERSQRIAEVTDAFPTPDWVPFAGKLVALTAVVLLFYAAGIVFAIGYQLISGYTDIEPELYLTEMLRQCAGFVLMGVLALFLQVISNNKFVGYVAVAVYLVVRATMGFLDLDDNLYRPFGAPPAPYSDMNGYGHFIVGHLWFRAYWGAFAGLLFIAGLLFWVRGRRDRFAERARDARSRLTPATTIAIVLLATAFVGIGVFNWYNTHVLNEYVAGDVALDRQAEYERLYRDTRGLPQPRIASMNTEVDIHPEQLRVDVRGRYELVNRHDESIDLLHVEVDRDTLQSVSLAPHVVEKADDLHDVTLYRLERPLAPGETMTFEFVLRFEQRGFTNGLGQTNVVHNGTFFNNFVFPTFGYEERRQIVDRNERRKRDLGEVPRMPKIDDEAARASTYLTDDADWIDFETVVSTSPEQIALAPGYLQREWTDNGRRYFHYKMDVPMMPFAAWLSADWDIRRGEWNGIPIEVYHHPEHDYNVDRMIEASQKSLAYFTEHFTPYQHKQLRILEFPGYQTFAQAFANTVPYSESIGFIADLRDPDDIDYVFFVTAHEVAHQWWAHQVIGANVQGATMLSESLAEYSALMVMEKEYGKAQMRRFLKYELDQYLMMRATELVEELPLSLVENQQYLHYRKGALVFYALKEAIGEDTLNGILKRFLQDKGYQQPPYTTSRELLAYLYEGTDPQHHRLIADLFEKIVFFDNRVTKASVVQRDDGKYVVTLDLHVAKLEAQGKGEETGVALDDEIEIGVFARAPGAEERDERVLYLERHRITETDTTLEIVVDELPYEAGIDPYNKLIDRVSSDNRRTLEL